MSHGLCLLTISRVKASLDLDRFVCFHRIGRIADYTLLERKRCVFRCFCIDVHDWQDNACLLPADMRMMWERTEKSYSELHSGRSLKLLSHLVTSLCMECTSDVVLVRARWNSFLHSLTNSSATVSFSEVLRFWSRRSRLRLTMEEPSFLFPYFIFGPESHAQSRDFLVCQCG